MSNNSAVLDRKNIYKEEFLDLWKRIEASGSGEPGLYFTNNLDWGTNPCCFTGEMKLLTPSGYKTFKELSGEGQFEFINKDGKIVEGNVWSNGQKETICLNIQGGKQIVCTPDHILMNNKGEEIEAKDTKGVRLMPYFEINKEITEFTKLGFIQGDGGTGRLASKSHKGLEIFFGEKDSDVAEIFNSSEGNQYIIGFNEKLKELGFSPNALPERDFPTHFSSLKDEEKLQFLKGLYSANGCVVTSSRIAFKTTCRLLAFKLKEYIKQLSKFQVEPYITTNKAKEIQFSNGNYTCKESYDVNIGKIEDIKWFSKNIGFIQEYKQKSLSNLIINRAPLVNSIGKLRLKEVFDFNLQDDTHWGVVEGIIAHNCEIGLRPYQFCNLCEINVSDIESQEDLNKRSEIAAFFGTLQAGFTNFHYLRPIWAKTTQKDALLGIGMTGIGSGVILNYDLKEATDFAIKSNQIVSQLIGINEAARITCIKPSGTSSCVLGTSSGIHAWHNNYYLRTMRFNKNEDIALYLSINHPELCENDVLRPKDTLCVRIPVKAPEGSIFRTESAIDTLERVKKFSKEWVRNGHIHGDNTHNVSATISIDKNRLYNEVDEWKIVGEWMWNNREYYNGLSVLPYFGGTYQQAPFEDITKEKYEEKIQHLKSIDLKNVMELDDTVDFGAIQACAGGQCDIS